MYILSYYNEINYGLESASNIICYLLCEEESAAFDASDSCMVFCFISHIGGKFRNVKFVQNVFHIKLFNL